MLRACVGFLLWVCDAMFERTFDRDGSKEEAAFDPRRLGISIWKIKELKPTKSELLSSAVLSFFFYAITFQPHELPHA